MTLLGKENGRMTRRELELLESDFDESSSHDRFHRPRQAPRRRAARFPRQRRAPGIPLGINARGAKRSTFRSLGLRKIRAVAMPLPNNTSLALTPATQFST